MRRLFLPVVVSALMAACGGGGSPAQPAPTGLSYPTPDVLVLGTGVVLSPTVTGTVSSYRVSPQLPPGLAIDAGTGQISGTPTAVAASTTYTVTATNSGGSAAFGVSITVNDTAPSISYGVGLLPTTVGVAVQTLTPTNTGGAVVAWTVSPALPPGLTLGASDGSISGTPTAEAAPGSYVVTAVNSGGQSSATVRIDATAILLELGHDTDVNFIQSSGTRVLSAGSNWVLWDSASGNAIADGAGTARLAGPVLAQETHAGCCDMGFEMRASSDGHVLSEIPARYFWWKLAADGSYVCAGSERGLWAWSPSGTLLVSRTGDFSASLVYAAPGEVRVALGPAGQDVIETISVATGSSVVGPRFQGLFHSWFLDGERFLTHAATTVWVYSRAGDLQDSKILTSLASLTGQGNWFWNLPGTLDIYAVGASAQPAATYVVNGQLVPSGLAIGVLDVPLGVIDLSGASPSRTDHVLPGCGGCTPLGFTSLPATGWFVGQRSVVLDGSSLTGTPRYFGLGAVLGIAAGGGERVAVATNSGHILIVNVLTKAVERRIDAYSSMMAMSPDGASLYAAMDPHYGIDRSIKKYSVSSGAEVASAPYANGTYTELVEMMLAAPGTTLALGLRDSAPGMAGNYRHEVLASLGGPVQWSDSGVITYGAVSYDWTNPAIPPFRISPDGTLIATSNGLEVWQAATDVLKDGNLVATVPGLADVWLDDGRLLVSQYSLGSSVTGIDSIYDPTGIRQMTTQFRAYPDSRMVGSDAIYSPTNGQVISVSTGATLWQSLLPGRSGIGAATGTHVVFPSGVGPPRVYAEPY